MKVGVADAAEEDLDLHVVLGRIAPRDRGGGQRRCRTGGGIGFRLVHGLMLLLISFVGPVLLVADLFHPVDGLAVELLLNGDVRHRRGGSRPVPVLFARRKPDDVTRPDFLDRAAPALRPAAAGRHDQRLTERMRVPGRPGTGLKGDAGTSHTPRRGCFQ